MNPIVAVIVTYNRLDLLKLCLKAVNKQTIPCDILLINNASTDNTEQWGLEQEKNNPAFHYVNTGKNTGGAGGFNLGMRLAIEKGYEYVWVMDDDCIPQGTSLEELIKADKLIGKNNYGCLSSLVLWTDGTACKMNRQGIGDKVFSHFDYLEKGIISIDSATFVSLLFPADVIRQAGLPIRDYYIWNDDIEYTRRLSTRMNLPCYLVSASKVTHLMKTNNGSDIITDSPERLGRYRYEYRNECFTYRLEGPRTAFLNMKRCIIVFIKILVCAKDHRLKRCYVLLRGIWEGLWFKPEIETFNNINAV